MNVRGEDWDGDTVPEGLWQQRVWQVMHSKYGLNVLRDVRASLLAMEDKRLYGGSLVAPLEGVTESIFDQPDQPATYCIIGVWVRDKLLASGKPLPEVHTILASYSEEDITGSSEVATKQGMRWTMAWTLAQENDSAPVRYVSDPDAARYRYMLGWVTGKIEQAEAHLGVGGE